MKIFLVPALLIGGLALVQCSEAQSSKPENDAPAKAQFTKLGNLPRQVPESSGMAQAGKEGEFYTMGDAGNIAVLYRVNKKGELLEKIKLPVPNRDWESLSEDNRGNIFVADCGNNNNNRRDLVIYKLNPSAPEKVGEIKFSYPDQKDFPPKKKERNFDSEASVWHNGSVYLFTRDRGQAKTCNVYKLPDEPGQHVATKTGSIKVNAEITGAAVSPDGTKMVLIANEQVFLFKGNNFNALLTASPENISLKGTGQTEGVLFLNDNTLLLTNEEGGIFSYSL